MKRTEIEQRVLAAVSKNRSNWQAIELLAIAGDVMKALDEAGLIPEDRPEPKRPRENPADLTPGQSDVLKVIRLVGPGTDEDLVEAYQEWSGEPGVTWLSASGIRSRRAELARMGLVVDTGLRQEHSWGGRTAKIWEAKP